MSVEEKPSISLLPDGPLLVNALKKCMDDKGPIETEATMALCRCGHSGNKPFCDGTHATAGFTSAKLEGRMPDKKMAYAGQEITIFDNRGLCAHAGVCTDQLARVFRMKEEPWIVPDAATTAAIITVIDNCPSGALSYSLSSAKAPKPEQEPIIFIAPNGPYVVSGGIDLLEATWGDGASQSEYTLCRCGASKNKPFCDGSHWGIKFDGET